jgi:hypothetical protein
MKIYYPTQPIKFKDYNGNLITGTVATVYHAANLIKAVDDNANTHIIGLNQIVDYGATNQKDQSAANVVQVLMVVLLLISLLLLMV